MLTEKWLFLEIFLYNFCHVDSLDDLPSLSISLRDIPKVLAFEVETVLTDCDANFLVMYKNGLIRKIKILPYNFYMTVICNEAAT